MRSSLALPEWLSPGAEASSVRNPGGTMVVGVAASPPLCQPASCWKSIAGEVSGVHWGMCSSVLQIREVSALCPSMAAGLEARVLCYSCLKNSLPVLFCFT